MFKACDKIAARLASNKNFWHLIKFTKETVRFRLCNGLYWYVKEKCGGTAPKKKRTKKNEFPKNEKERKKKEKMELKRTNSIRKFELDQSEPTLI